MDSIIFRERLIENTKKMVKIQENIGNSDNIFSEYKIYYNFLIENKEILQREEYTIFLNDCKQELCELYYIDNWKDANSIHNSLFGEFCSSLYFLPK